MKRHRWTTAICLSPYTGWMSLRILTTTGWGRMQRIINLSRSEVCIIFHNMWEALVPRRRRLKVRQVLLGTEEIKTVTKGDPWRLREVFPLFSSRDNAFLHVVRQASAPKHRFLWFFGGFFANIVPRAKSLVRRGDLFLLQVYLSSRYFTICHKL